MRDMWWVVAVVLAACAIAIFHLDDKTRFGAMAVETIGTKFGGMPRELPKPHLESLWQFGADPATVTSLQQATVDERREEFLDEEGVAFRALHDDAPNRRRQLDPEELLDQPARVLRSKRLKDELRSVRAVAAPPGAAIEQLRDRKSVV